MIEPEAQYPEAEISSKTPKPEHDLPTAAVTSPKRVQETVAQSSTKSMSTKDIVSEDLDNIRRFWKEKENPQADSIFKYKKRKRLEEEEVSGKRCRTSPIASSQEDEHQAPLNPPLKVNLPGIRHKYVATGHGQYKRVPIEDDEVRKK